MRRDECLHSTIEYEYAPITHSRMVIEPSDRWTYLQFEFQFRIECDHFDRKGFFRFFSSKRCHFQHWYDLQLDSNNTTTILCHVRCAVLCLCVRVCLLIRIECLVRFTFKYTTTIRTRNQREKKNSFSTQEFLMSHSPVTGELGKSLLRIKRWANFHMVFQLGQLADGEIPFEKFLLWIPQRERKTKLLRFYDSFFYSRCCLVCILTTFNCQKY